jgi:alkanesulfonate monooxygenase SsuD/methylene tetrahydromethanopterin reductase-like flavin-dependent oxidoreductase (luciferase family)
MRVALMIEGQEEVSWEQWLALAHACEEARIEALFRSDHYESVFGFEERAALDAWSTLAALAAATERVRLGTLVSPVTFRHAGELAKVVATVDNISGGRVELGLGAGWNESEHEHFGFPFPDLSERMDELERQLEHVTRQWAERPPKPVQQPRPPLILGGHARPRGVRLAARYADEYNSAFATPAECAGRRARVVAACEEAGREPIPFSLMTVCVVGRDPDEVVERIRRQSAVTGRDEDPVAALAQENKLIGTVDEVVARLHAYADAGVERVYLQHLDHTDLEMVRLIGSEIVTSVAASAAP